MPQHLTLAHKAEVVTFLPGVLRVPSTHTVCNPSLPLNQQLPQNSHRYRIELIITWNSYLTRILPSPHMRLGVVLSNDYSGGWSGKASMSPFTIRWPCCLRASLALLTASTSIVLILV
jgi:hypothetical protein